MVVTVCGVHDLDYE